MMGLKSILVCMLLASPTVSEIPVPDRLLDVRTADVTGDGRVDLLVAAQRDDDSREVRVHVQGDDGRFAAEPQRSVSIKKDIVAWSLADVHPEAGVELLLFTRRSCFGYRTGQDGYRKAAKRLCAFEFLCDMPDRGSLPFVECAMDLDGDGVTELILPGVGGYGVFKALGSTYTASGWIPASVPDSRPGAAERDLSISIGFHSGRPYPNHDSVLKEPGGSVFGPLLDSARWLPALERARINGDDRDDLILIDENTVPASLVVYLQKQDGTFASEPSLRVPVPAGGRLRVADVDGDGLGDLVAHESDADEQTLRIYRNRKGDFETASPDQMLRFGALGLRFDVADLDGSPGNELAITSYGIASKLEVLTGAVERKLLVYRRDSAGKRIFERRPALARAEKLTAASFKTMESPLDVSGDLDGSGIHDLVMVDPDGALVAYSISKGLKLSSVPYRTHVPEYHISRFQLVDLTGNGRSDVILHMKKRLQILVSP